MDLFQHMPCPSVITDLEGKVLIANKALLAQVGKSSLCMGGIYIDELMTPASRIFMQTHIWPMLRNETFINEAYITLKGSEGIRVPIMLNCTSIEYEGKPVYCWILYVALERSNFEAELVKARNDLEIVNKDLAVSRGELLVSEAALNLSNTEMERFIYSVSHDLKGPLVTISGFSNQLLFELEAQLSSKQKRRFNRILENAKGMDNMLTDLLALSKVIQQDIEKSNLDINKITNQQFNLLKSRVKDSGASISVVESLPSIFANERLVQQCLLNLLSNAINYKSPERKLHIEVSGSITPDFTSIHIRDNGIGIAKSDQQRIFRIFEHLSEDMGTGVGLAIVKAAMDKHKGKVTVESTVGSGSCFSLCFPTTV